MDRRDFLKSVVFLPSLSMPFNKTHPIPFQIYILSTFPEKYIPFLLEKISKFGLIKDKSFSFSGFHPAKSEISKVLFWKGYKRSSTSANLKISYQELKNPASPSFTIIVKGQILDPRKKELFNLWEKMAKKEFQTSQLTIISQDNPMLIEKGKFTKISIAGKEVARLPLFSDLEKTYSCIQGKVLVSIKNGKAWIEESSCKGKICVKTSPVSFVGERIICAPNRFLLEIKGNLGVDTSIG